jgi:hypothetical protein
LFKLKISTQSSITSPERPGNENVNHEISHSAPIYSFAEDVSFNAANIILTGGHKCFASSNFEISQ